MKHFGRALCLAKANLFPVKATPTNVFHKLVAWLPPKMLCVNHLCQLCLESSQNSFVDLATLLHCCQRGKQVKSRGNADISEREGERRRGPGNINLPPNFYLPSCRCSIANTGNGIGFGGAAQSCALLRAVGTMNLY